MRWLNNDWPRQPRSERIRKEQGTVKTTVTKALVLFLLTPDPRSHGYKLFVVSTPCIQSNAVSRSPLSFEQVKTLARGETISNKEWVAYDTVKHGFFYSATGGQNRRLMTVVEGASLCYWNRDSKLTLLGNLPLSYELAWI
jgi:hypothetical protein